MRRLYSNDTATSDLETLPTTQAYEIKLVTRTSNSIQIRWTQGSEKNAIVLIKKEQVQVLHQLQWSPVTVPIILLILFMVQVIKLVILM